LSDALWRGRFCGDRPILGRHITLDDNNYVVIGGMPSGFENVLAPSAQLWAPLQYDLSQGGGTACRRASQLRLHSIAWLVPPFSASC
jgi:hypothetical protein